MNFTCIPNTIASGDSSDFGMLGNIFRVRWTTTDCGRWRGHQSFADNKYCASYYGNNMHCITQQWRQVHMLILHSKSILFISVVLGCSLHMKYVSVWPGSAFGFRVMYLHELHSAGHKATNQMHDSLYASLLSREWWPTSVSGDRPVAAGNLTLWIINWLFGLNNGKNYCRDAAA